MRINFNSVLEGAELKPSELRKSILFILLKEKSVRKENLITLLLEKNPNASEHQILCALAEMQKKNLILTLSVNDATFYSLTPKVLVKVLKDSLDNASEKVGAKVGDFVHLTEEEISKIIKEAKPQWEELSDELKEGMNKIKNHIRGLFD